MEYSVPFVVLVASQVAHGLNLNIFNARLPGGGNGGGMDGPVIHTVPGGTSTVLETITDTITSCLGGCHKVCFSCSLMYTESKN